MPSFGKYSGLSIADDASHTVSYDRSFKAGEGSEEEEVAPEDVGKAYKVDLHLFLLQITAMSKCALGRVS